MRTFLGRLFLVAGLIAIATLIRFPRPLVAEEGEEGEIEQAPLKVPAPGRVRDVTSVKADATAEIRFDDLARQEILTRQKAQTVPLGPRVRTWMPNEHEAPPSLISRPRHTAPSSEFRWGPWSPRLLPSSASWVSMTWPWWIRPTS